MSLLFCRQENVKQPYYFEELGIHIFSSQELSYVIYNHPFLVLEDFMEARLINFIRDELDMGFLALKLEKLQKSGENSDELLLVLLQETYYYNAAEINKYRQLLTSIRKMHPADYEKSKADYLFNQKQYGKAINCYEKILIIPKDLVVNDILMGKVLNNLGSAYARMFLFDKAFQAYQKAYGFNKESAVLQKLYYLTRVDPSLELKERYLSLIDEETKAAWDQGLIQAGENAKSSDSLAGLYRLYLKDPIKRLAGAGEIVQKWKLEYRNMM